MNKYCPYDTVDAELYDCAAKCERAGYDVKHVDPDSNTGVLLEAHPKHDTIDEAGWIIIQWNEDTISVTLPSETIETYSTHSACSVLLDTL